MFTMYLLLVLKQGLVHHRSPVIVVEQMNHDHYIFRFFLHFDTMVKNLIEFSLHTSDCSN